MTSDDASNVESDATRSKKKRSVDLTAYLGEVDEEDHYFHKRHVDRLLNCKVFEFPILLNHALNAAEMNLMKNIFFTHVDPSCHFTIRKAAYVIQVQGCAHVLGFFNCFFEHTPDLISFLKSSKRTDYPNCYHIRSKYRFSGTKMPEKRPLKSREELEARCNGNNMDGAVVTRLDPVKALSASDLRNLQFVDMLMQMQQKLLMVVSKLVLDLIIDSATHKICRYEARVNILSFREVSSISGISARQMSCSLTV